MNEVNTSKKKILDVQPGRSEKVLIFREANSPSTLKISLLMPEQNSLLKPGVQHFLVLKDESSQIFMNFTICTFRERKHFCCLAFNPPSLYIMMVNTHFQAGFTELLKISSVKILRGVALY